jgi:hypothetical protein
MAFSPRVFVPPYHGDLTEAPESGFPGAGGKLMAMRGRYGTGRGGGPLSQGVSTTGPNTKPVSRRISCEHILLP